MPNDSTPRSFALRDLHPARQLRCRSWRAAPSGPRARSARRRRSAAARRRPCSPGRRSACRRSGASRARRSRRPRCPAAAAPRARCASTSSPAMVRRAARSRGSGRRLEPFAQPMDADAHACSPRSTELPQEAQVVLEIQADVVHAVAQHGEPLDAHAERVAGVALRDRCPRCAARSGGPCRSRRSRASRCSCRRGSPGRCRTRTRCPPRPTAR